MGPMPALGGNVGHYPQQGTRDGRDWEIVIPLRDTVADYAEFMAEAVAVLAEAEDRSQLDVF